MGTERIYNNALEIAKFVSAPDDVKLDIFTKYGLLADATLGGAGFDLVRNNVDTFIPLLSDNVMKWVMTEKGKPVYNRAIKVNPRISKIFESENSINNLRNTVLNELGTQANNFEGYDNIMTALRLFGLENAMNISEDDIIMDEIDDTIDLNIEFEDDTIVEQPVETTEVKDKAEVEGYVEKIHGGYRRQIEKLILSAWEDLYGYHVDGKEIVDGFVVPGGAILGTGETIKYEGVLTLNNSKIVVKPNTMSNAIYEEFIGACRECGIEIIKEVADDSNEVKPFKYNPMLQRRIASGAINQQAFKNGWQSYSEALAPYIVKKTKELAITRAETGSDEETFRTLSGYIISLMVVNYKDELGTQLRICCGDTSKTAQVSERLVTRLRAREKTHKSIAQGKLVVGNPIPSDSGLSATITVYQNMAGYQAVPQFMGELLCNLTEGMFKPSLKKMIIGLDMKNNIVTAPFTKWLLPIIAGSRSGKGVLTLNMLLNVIGGGTPLFYLDGKPDMAALLWKLQEKYNVPNAIVIDGIGYQGVTDVDRKQYRAPYADNLEKMMGSPSADEILESNYGVMIYLKTMMVILLSTRYYKDKMGSPYGDIFVVFDEMYKVMKAQVETLVMNIDTALAKLDKSEKERKSELLKIKMWVQELLVTYTSNDIGVFGAGIKAVALTQFAQDGQYNVSGFTPAKTFCTNFLLKRGVKLFGRQEGGSGTYGVQRDKNDEIEFDLYDKYFHFGIGTEQGNTYNNLKTFKPLLVLNENDCKEMTGEATDGAFTADMLGRVSMYTDLEQFRNKYFTDKDLSESIGFEGALSQVGRLLGVDWKEMLRQSLSRSYEIADAALRYYGIIGVDGIESVYDYICSFENNHLWSYNEIIRAKAKGAGLGGNGSNDGSSEQSVFEGLEENFEGEEVLDFGEDSKQAPTFNGEKTPNFGGDTKRLSKEEQEILKNIEDRRNNQDTEIDEKLEDYDELDYENTDEIDAKPSEGVRPNEEPTFRTAGNTGKKINVNPTRTSSTVKLTPENSIQASLSDAHPLEKFEKTLFKTLRGSNYEFSQRWDAILSSVSKRINADMVTRVMLVQDEMYVNGRFVSTENIIGGFANIRLEDLVNYKATFKRFKNITELTLDLTMVERFQIEQPNLPTGFFAYSPKLLKVNILLENGTKEVVDRRSQTISDDTKETIEFAKHRSQFESVCAGKNPRLKEKSPGYQSTVWNATKSFGGKGWQAMGNQMSKKNPSFIKAAGIGLITTGVVAVGATLFGVTKLFNLFRR